MKGNPVNLFILAIAGIMLSVFMVAYFINLSDSVNSEIIKKKNEVFFKRFVSLINAGCGSSESITTKAYGDIVWEGKEVCTTVHINKCVEVDCAGNFKAEFVDGQKYLITINKSNVVVEWLP